MFSRIPTERRQEMIISMIDWKFVLLLAVVVFLTFTAGVVYEWSRTNGHSDKIDELKLTRKELEQSREMLYNLTHHAAYNPVARAAQARKLHSINK